MKKEEDWLFESNNMLLNNIWCKEAAEKRKKEKEERETYFQDYNDKSEIAYSDQSFTKKSDLYKLVHSIVYHGILISPLITAIVTFISEKCFKYDIADNFIVLMILVLPSVWSMMAIIFLLLGDYGLINYIDKFADGIARFVEEIRDDRCKKAKGKKI